MLPTKFLERMKHLLCDEYDSFYQELSQSAVAGVRVCKIKGGYDLENIAGYGLTPIEYAEGGYIPSERAGLGSTAEHHAGRIYIQDPAAMATLCALDIQEGWWVLDVCAAPGGKSTQAAEKIGPQGFIHSNEYVPKRAKTLVQNFERLGIANGIVTSLDTERLGALYSAVFDLVIADAPCSGEGMFRKSEDAVLDWSEENILACAKRQSQILDNVADTVKHGGYLLYSTCTYAPEENELVIDAFLRAHPDFTLVDVNEKLRAATADGYVPQGCDQALGKCRRFYPHLSRGEGQFIALMKRSCPDELPTILYKDSARELSKEQKSAVCDFFRKNLVDAPDARICRVGENIVLMPHGAAAPPASVFCCGALLGTVEKGRLVPSHQFTNAYAHLFRLKENLAENDARVARYLHGEQIEAHDVQGDGWCAVLYKGTALGCGKAVGGIIKNHYPKGLRTKG